MEQMPPPALNVIELGYDIDADDAGHKFYAQCNVGFNGVKRCNEFTSGSIQMGRLKVEVS